MAFVAEWETQFQQVKHCQDTGFRFFQQCALVVSPCGAGEIMRKTIIRNVPPGWRPVYCRFRRVKNSSRVLDAWDYGYETWCFLVRTK
jgi:hypothetical protein